MYITAAGRSQLPFPSSLGPLRTLNEELRTSIQGATLMQGSKHKMRAIPILAVAIAFRSLSGFAQEPIIPRIAVGPQYDSTHVYVAPEYVDAFVKAFLGTFGGES